MILLLKLKNIKKDYVTGNEKVHALKGIDLEFRDHEFVSILGPSGCGKTTLLNIIGGLDDYTTGDLIISGKSTKEYKDRDWDTYRNHRVGFVFQSYNLIPHQTVFANVELALTLSGIPASERKRRVKEVLKKVGLADQMDKKPNQMSGGQMQRVAIARALVNDPEILLADEPTGALDSKTSEQVMNILKEIANDRLIIMVTHNADIANTYSNRIITLKDGEVIDDTKPYNSKKENVEDNNLIKKKSKKTSMSFKTALQLSLNNLMTKKGRTFLTSFAGSIGIIGIALILSLSNGVQEFIDKTERETLAGYPLSIQKESVDMTGLIENLTGNQESKEYNDNKIHSINILGDMFTTMSEKVEHNDLKSFKNYLESNKSKINDYVSDIQYSYNVQLNLYKNNSDKVVQVNPTTIMDALGMNMSGVSNVYSTYMSNYDVFYEMINNEELNKQQYDLVDGHWPTKYNEVVILVDKNNQILDYTLYSLGILDQDDLKEQFVNMTSGKEVKFANTSYDTKDLLNLSFKLVLNTDYYTKVNGIWVDKSDDDEYMQKVIKDAEEIKVVGIIRPNEEAVTTNSFAGMVGYTHELMEHLINKINETKIVSEQLKNKDINVFTGREFSANETFNYKDLTPEELKRIQSLSPQELEDYMKTYADNMTSSYEENMRKLGIADVDDPDQINIYPKDFDSKEEIVKIIDKYNEGKKEEAQISYTDVVGIMMSSVSTIVNVISYVLMAFVAISLIVSSIMIGIITYISVLERTKEIGILRAIGASKKDISRVFNAETVIEGFSAGTLGIIVTLILNIPINALIKHVANISNAAILPWKGAIILIVISVVLTAIAGLMPARVASKKDPVVALRTE